MLQPPTVTDETDSIATAAGVEMPESLRETTLGAAIIDEVLR